MSPRGAVVYVVDDETSVREALSELFSSLGIEHVTFSSASEYLGFVRTDKCACLVLDLQMPEINGLDLQRQIANECCPPIIFITGHGDIPSTVRAMKAGAAEFFTKPLDLQALVAAIRAAFAKDLQERQKTAELSALQQRFSLLTPREREVLPLVTSGMLNKQAAATLGITDVTLQVHRGQIMRKMEAKSFADLVKMAGKLGIPKPDTAL
jgi:FixJ family two-component response regulator